MATLKIAQVIAVSDALHRIKSEKLSGKPIYAIAKNIGKAETDVRAFNKKRDEIIKQVSGGKNTIPATDLEGISAFNEKVEQELGTEVEIEFHRFILTEEQLGGNISPRDLAILIEHGVVTVLEVAEKPADAKEEAAA